MSSPSQTILVTGGAGFIGSTFLRLMVPRHPDRLFVNLDKLTYAADPEGLTPLRALANYRFVQGDVADEALLQTLFGEHGPQWVFHFAAESHVDRSIVDPYSFIRTNVEGTFRLLEACRAAWGKAGAQRLVHVSTDEVYGSCAGPAFGEDSRYNPSSPYAASKAASDHLVRAYSKTYGLPVLVSNCTNNYGPRQFPEKLIPLMILKALSGEPLPVYGQGLNVRDWLFVEDHCEALWAIASRGRPGETYNVGGGAELANLEVVRTICRAVARRTGRPEEQVLSLISFVPDRPGHDLRYALCASKIEQELGWRPLVGFEEGLQKTVEWYARNQEWSRRIWQVTHP